MNKIKKIESTSIEVFEKGDQLWTTSLDIAEKFGKRHDHVLEAIREMECSDDFRIPNFRESIYKNEQNKDYPMYLISRSGFSFLVMGFKGKKAALWKEKYITAFDRMEKTILHLARQKELKAQLEYQQARAESKIIRREETDTIQKFVEYAFAQGSKNAKKYYVNITQMENKALFYFEQAIEKPNNLREWLDRMQLTQLVVAENLVNRTLVECMNKGMYYKEIYRVIKERVETYATCIGKSPVLLSLPTANNDKLLLIHNSN